MEPTSEQRDIIEAALKQKDSLLINALAGAAKTTTLEMIASAMPIQPILSLAFNKRIAEEMKNRLPGHVQPMTLNSIGHRTWAAATGRRLTLEKDKIYGIFKAQTEGLARGRKAEVLSNTADYLKAIRQARVAGYIPASLGKSGPLHAKTSPKASKSRKKSTSPSSTPALASPFDRPTRGQLTLMIRYTCPHCSEGHSLDIPLSWLTKPKTSQALTTRCLKIYQPLPDLWLWVTRGKAFTASGVQCSLPWDD
jgi:hypothetical protein